MECKMNNDDCIINVNRPRKSFINEYLYFINNIPDEDCQVLNCDDIIDLTQDSNETDSLITNDLDTQEIIDNIIDLEADYEIDSKNVTTKKNIELNSLNTETNCINENEGSLVKTCRVNKNFEKSLDTEKDDLYHKRNIYKHITTEKDDIELNLINTETKGIYENEGSLEKTYRINKNFEILLNTEKKYKNINTELDPINREINDIDENEGSSKKTLNENFDSDDIPLSQLSDILKDSKDSVGSFNFDFITEDEAKLNGLYYLNDPIQFMEGYFPPPKKIKKHTIPSGNNYLELFQQYPSCLMDMNKSIRPSVSLNRYCGVGFDIETMSISNDVSLELKRDAADSYKKIVNLYPQANKRLKR